MNEIVRRFAFGATVRGRGHLKKNIPNQDAFAIKADENLGVYILVVSDGAGSASQSHIGSQKCVEALATEFLTIGCNIVTGRFSASWVEDKILLAIGKHIETLESLGGALRDYHHTLSAVIATSTGGRVIQIGDSPIVVTRSIEVDGAKDLSTIFEHHEVLDEVKGEYANETHFITQPDWRKNIRITPLPSDYGAVLVMTDGAGRAFISRGKVHAPSTFALLSEVLEQSDKAIQATERYLTDPQLDEITADDKTFVGLIPITWMNSITTRVDRDIPSPQQVVQAVAISKGSKGDSGAKSQQPEHDISEKRGVPPSELFFSQKKTPALDTDDRIAFVEGHLGAKSKKQYFHGILVGVGVSVGLLAIGGAAVLAYQHLSAQDQKPINSNGRVVTGVESKEQFSGGRPQGTSQEGRVESVIEAEAKAKLESEVEAKREAEARAKWEADAKAKKEAEARAKWEADAKAKKEAEARAKSEADAKAKKEAEAKAKREAEARTKLEADAKAKREAEARAELEAKDETKRESREDAKRIVENIPIDGGAK